MSRYYDEDDELDIRIRRPSRQNTNLSIEEGRRDFPGERSIRSRPPPIPGPVVYPEHRRPDHRSFPRRPPIYPPRGIRRASTLPVRFEDEILIPRPSRPDLPPPRQYQNYQIREDVVTRPVQGRRASVDTLRSSDSEAERTERREETLSDVVMEGEPLMGRDDENVTRPNPVLGVEELRSRSKSPVRDRKRVEDENGDGEAEENLFPKEGKTRMPAHLVNRRALVTLGYPYEEDGGFIIIQKALSRKNIDDVIKLSADYGPVDSVPRPRHRTHSPFEARERVVIETSRSRSRSRSPVHRTRYDDNEREYMEQYPTHRSRSRSHRSPLYYEEDEDLEQEAFLFTLSRHRKSLMSRDSTAGSLSDISEKDSDPASQAPASSPQAGKICEVLQSQYTGDCTIGGFQSAALKVSEETIHGVRKSSQSVFRWVRFEDIHMNFDRFESASESITGLTDNQKSAISKLFSKVRRKFDQQPIPAPDGSKIRYMAPDIHHEPVPRSEKVKAGTVTWMCLPYFFFDKYAGSLSGLSTSSHPMRTLLQTQYSFTSKARDMQQAVRQLPGCPPEHCYHIAQVWTIVLDDSLIITCSRTAIKTLMGKSLSVTPESSSPEQSRTRRSRSTNLLVNSGNLLWSLPIAECQTWFAFVSHFWEYWPKRLQFSSGGKIITPDSWLKFLGQASNSKHIVRISLDIRPGVKEPRGILLDSHDSNPSADDLSNGPETARQDEPKNEAAQDPPSTSTPAENPTETVPGLNSEIEGEGSSSVSQSATTPKSRTQSPKPHQANKNQENHRLGKNFHVFAWLNEAQSTTFQMANPLSSNGHLSPDMQSGGVNVDKSFILDELNLRADLKEIDRFLKRQTSFEQRLVYEECPQSTRRAAYLLLQVEGKEIAVLSAKDPSRTIRTAVYEDRVQIFNKAELLFQFFLPSGVDGRTVGKYWGAVHRLLVALSPKPEEINPYRLMRHTRELDPESFIQWISYITRHTQVFRELFSEASSSERSTMVLPEEIPKAWLHALLALVFSSKEQYMGLCQDQMAICSQLLNDGMQKVVDNLSQKSLLGYAVFKPWELASLVNFGLLGDITAQSRNTSDTYLTYLNALTSAIDASPLDRGHQDKLTAFKQEIKVILQTLKQQRHILSYAERVATATRPSEITTSTQNDVFINPRESSYRDIEHLYPSHSRSRSYSRPEAAYASHPTPVIINVRGQTPGSQIDATDPSGIQGLLIQDSYELIDRKMRLFQDLRDRATELEDENNFKIDYNKDRQDSAIYAFTIVTIIFLPLSTVAGILGMNTNDVRNMEINQWVFWATALPLTVIIITLCLIWAGELENFWKGFSNLWGGNKKRSGARGAYSMLTGNTDAYSMMDARAELGRRRPYIVEERDREREYEVERYRPSHLRSRSRAPDYYDDY